MAASRPTPPPRPTRRPIRDNPRLLLAGIFLLVVVLVALVTLARRTARLPRQAPTGRVSVAGRMRGA